MLNKYFVALTFKSDSTLFRKIDGLKRRFDPKYQSHAFPHMSMLAPFVTDEKNEETIAEMLKEEVNTFFYGYEGAMKLSFTGLDIHKYKKNHILYLNPHYDADLSHCIDLVQSVCESFIPKSIGYKQNKKQFLPLGHFQTPEQLAPVIEDLKDEFSVLSELKVDSIVLLKKVYGQWKVKEEIFTFEDNYDHLLQIHSMAL